MGRFGNVFLVNGEPDYHLRLKRGEVVRFFLTNAANARMMNLSFPNARMKLVGSDLGPYQQDEWVSSVVIAPAERYIVDVRFDRAGTVPLGESSARAQPPLWPFFRGGGHAGPGGGFGQGGASGSRAAISRQLKHHAEVAAELERYRRGADRAPEKTLILTLHTTDLPAISQRLMQLDSIYFPPVEWSGTMPMMNWASTGRQVRWVLQDRDSGKENMDIAWHFRRGQPVRIKLVNQRQSVHAMQHPIHFHGQRFLVLAVNGEPNQNLVWKDTVLVPAGSTVDILLDPSNPGRWMAHCHIAEHSVRRHDGSLHRRVEILHFVQDDISRSGSHLGRTYAGPCLAPCAVHFAGRDARLPSDPTRWPRRCGSTCRWIPAPWRSPTCS